MAIADPTNPANIPPFPTSADKTMERAVQGAHDTIDRVASSAGPAVEKLRTGANQAADMLRTQADTLNQMQKEWVDGARACVRDHPLASVAVAVAAGMLLARLTAPR